MKNWKKTHFGVNYMVVDYEDKDFRGIPNETFGNLMYEHKKWMNSEDIFAKPANNVVVFTFSTENLLGYYGVTPNTMFEEEAPFIFDEPWDVDHIHYGEEFDSERVEGYFEKLANKTHGRHIEYWRESQYWKGHPADLYIVIVKMEKAIIDAINEEQKEAEKQAKIDSVFE